MAKKTRKILSSFAVFDSAEEGGYNVSFPDFPGCVTLEKLLKKRRECKRSFGIMARRTSFTKQKNQNQN